jgi:hypothetical protein
MNYALLSICPVMPRCLQLRRGLAMNFTSLGSPGISTEAPQSKFVHNSVEGTDVESLEGPNMAPCLVHHDSSTMSKLSRAANRNSCELSPKPAVFRKHFLHDKQHSAGVQTNSQEGILAGHYSNLSGEAIPTSSWVRVEGIPPLSSLQAILDGIRNAVLEIQNGSVLNMDAAWDSDSRDTLPVVENIDSDAWVQEARLILSPFGRPMGWHIRLPSRSRVFALLKYSQTNPLYCAWKQVKIVSSNGPNSADDLLFPKVTDATVRVENCPFDTNAISLIHFFSRFDLTVNGPPIELWPGKRSNNKQAPLTYIVHFADASWARAAIRELQSSQLKGRTVRLAQFPRQILNI